ncbi:LuxR C-terminal-related transcriptional regulator [Serratia sp. 14-2641]|jgi:DNA-binding NarL/FixJ family response regulator|uniref:helix-turn-helix transcriptional regulator n=1 Tax=Serratia sp. 14-2641 TaxID=1841657 RepID=UPI00080FCD79|nr:LuxR C-terminal-related transcriptional regulator [Serratia sp. 14-2641]OCJ19709.1 hypothetical protein A6U95_17110 [Serratia sp. 14-2641]
MLLFDTNYPCPLNKLAFDSIIESLNAEPNSSLHHDESYIAFVDGDSTDLYSTIKQIYGLKKENITIYVITLLSKGKECSAMVKHLSDFIVDKKITYADLKNLVRVMDSAQPKTVADNIFGDIWGELLKSSQKENRVLKLLVEGYSQSQIAKMLHLSIKTVSGYKAKAVKRHGARNFNELYMLKFGNNHVQ